RVASFWSRLNLLLTRGLLWLDPAEWKMTFKSRIPTQWTSATALGVLLSGIGAVAQFPPGPGGPPMREKLKLVERFDKDGDKRLDLTERKVARAYVRSQPSARL